MLLEVFNLFQRLLPLAHLTHTNLFPLLEDIRS